MEREKGGGREERGRAVERERESGGRALAFEAVCGSRVAWPADLAPVKTQNCLVFSFCPRAIPLAELIGEERVGTKE